MIKQIVASGLLALVLGLTISSSDTCSCDQYYTSAECDGGLCKWNSTLSICTTLQCSQLSRYNCYMKKTCYWNANSSECLVLSSCSQLKGNSEHDCELQNFYCGWVSGSSCSDITCQYYDSTTCPSGCYNNDNSCQGYTSCSQYTSYNCPNDVRCWLDNNKCVPAQCSMFPLSYCYYVLTFPQQGTYQVTPCYNGTSCQNATENNLLSPEECNLKTTGLYHWSSNKDTQGSCIACKQSSSGSDSPNQGLIIQIMIVIVLMMA